jgi:cell division protein FtsB
MSQASLLRKSLLYYFLATSLIISFLIYNLFKGEYSILNSATFKQELSDKITELENTKAERLYYENKLDKLDPRNNFDLDLVDEEVRKNLFYHKKDEFVILIKDLKKEGILGPDD